ncbi:DUF4381 domain-containing protein [Arsukibacterium indicum]|uniref:DUF4381 domain-containing protein n=1 Tax=Arsukibacterium indicum TaxID=2848612 RepID=A0ABS6MFS3_9GAMM|nr:DUF4381 domain-containing protein [Arsukibacterium indicum]MBV2127670.1 DUF4381 domain-containing protein [Arsukibacterium indicum]
MAAKQQLLEQLVDIAEPAYQLSWQIPPGGYILIVIAIIALVYSGWRVYQRRRYLAAKRQAIALLAKIPPSASNQINQLLKRVIKHYAPRHPVLTASTRQWQHFLQQQLPGTPLPPLAYLLYQTSGDSDENDNSDDSQQFYNFARQWLKQLRPATIASSQSQMLSQEVADV